MSMYDMASMQPITKKLYPGQPKKRKTSKGFGSLASALKMKMRKK